MSPCFLFFPMMMDDVLCSCWMPYTRPHRLQEENPLLLSNRVNSNLVLYIVPCLHSLA
jgi:hypothetical protein